MSPFCCQPNAENPTQKRDDFRRFQLDVLKILQDQLEAGLAAVSAAINTIEAQANNSDSQQEDDAG